MTRRFLCTPCGFIEDFIRCPGSASHMKIFFEGDRKGHRSIGIVEKNQNQTNKSAAIICKKAVIIRSSLPSKKSTNEGEKNK